MANGRLLNSITQSQLLPAFKEILCACACVCLCVRYSSGLFNFLKKKEETLLIYPFPYSSGGNSRGVGWSELYVTHLSVSFTEVRVIYYYNIWMQNREPSWRQETAVQRSGRGDRSYLTAYVRNIWRYKLDSNYFRIMLLLHQRKCRRHTEQHRLWFSRS